MGKIKICPTAADTNKRRLFKYKPEMVKDALSAIKRGMPTARASTIFGVPRSTLRHKIAGEAPESSGKIGPDAILGKDIEDDLCTWIKTCAKMGFPVDKDGLAYSVKNIITERELKTPFKKNIPGKTWFKSFMARHPDLSLKQAEYLGKARANVTEHKIRHWFAETSILLGDDIEVLEHPSRIWNMDETAFFLNPKAGIILAEKGKPVYGTSSNSDKENITTLVAVNASGDIAPPLTIYKFDRLPASYIKKAPVGWSLGKSENGWMTAKTFFEYFANVFHPYLVKRQYTFPVIVFVDGHSSHLSLQFSQFCRENKIIVVCLLPNTTHILQPLDVAVFYPFKCQWRKAIKKWRCDHEGRDISKQEVPQLLSQILENHSFKASIVNGFRICGLYPFNANNVDYSKCLLTLKENTEVLNTSTGNSNFIQNIDASIDYLEYLESKLDKDVLILFKTHYNRKTNPTENLQALYDIWLKFKADNNTDVSPELIDVPNDIIEFSFPEFNLEQEPAYFIDTHEDNNNINNDCGSISVVLMETDVLPKNSIISNDANDAYRDHDILLNKIENIYFKDTNSLEKMEVDQVANESDVIYKDDQMQLINNDKERIVDIDENGILDELNTKPENSTASPKNIIKMKHFSGRQENKTLTLEDVGNEKHQSYSSSQKIRVISDIKLNYFQKTISQTDKENLHTTSEEQSKLNMNIECAKDKPQKGKIILGEILVFPKKSNMVNKKKSRTILPSVLTSDQWIEITEKREREKEENLMKKEERKKKREQNKIANEKKKYIKKKAIKENATHSVSSEETTEVEVQEVAETNLKPDVFVIIKYEHSFYPGKIIKKQKKGEYLISAMARTGLQDWKWPDERDEVTYTLDEIKEIIQPPTKRNARGAYVVKEMRKYKL